MRKIKFFPILLIIYIYFNHILINGEHLDNIKCNREWLFFFFFMEAGEERLEKEEEKKKYFI